MARKNRWYLSVPHPVVLLFGIMLVTVVLTYVLPAGTFERAAVDGRARVIPGSYHTVEQTPVGLLDLFRAFPLGFKTAAEIIFIVLASGIMFGVLEKTRTIENAVGVLVHRLGQKRPMALIILLTFIYGLCGVVVGYENNIALVPIAALISLSIGGDLILAAGMSVGAITVGFGLSPINPYTVGVGHQIAELPLFSGAGLRSALCFSGLSLLALYNVRYFRRIGMEPGSSLGQGLDQDGLELSQPLESYRLSNTNRLVLMVFLLGIGVMLYGVFVYGWYLNEVSAVFLMITIVVAIVARLGGRTLGDTVLRSVGVVAPGAFMVGYATAIKVLLEMGHIGDTIAYQLTELLQYLPLYGSAIVMSMAQSVINLFIPSGSGQALATLPIMIPVGELLQLTRQTTILAFQIGDGVTNLFNPTLGGLIAMLSLSRVPFDRWLRFIWPVVLALLLIAWVFLLVAVGIGYG